MNIKGHRKGPIVNGMIYQLKNGYHWTVDDTMFMRVFGSYPCFKDFFTEECHSSEHWPTGGLLAADVLPCLHNRKLGDEGAEVKTVMAKIDTLDFPVKFGFVLVRELTAMK